MKKLFISLVLFSAIAISIIAVCPDYPTIPTTVPYLIKPSSPGISNYPSSPFENLSLTMVINMQTECPPGEFIYLLSISNLVSTDKTRQYFQIGLSCDDFTIGLFFGDYYGWYTGDSATIGPVYPGRPMAFFLSFANFDSSPSNPIAYFEVETEGGSFPFVVPSENAVPFDANSEFYICADKDGASPVDCTISKFILEYRSYPGAGLTSAGQDHLGTSNPAIAGFYPLLDGSLAPSVGSLGSAYFGDKTSNPTSGTSPTWDSSNSFVTITAGQFLTFPLPLLASGNFAGSKSFGFAAWLKITSLSAGQNNIFAMYAADGITQKGPSFKVKKLTEETGEVSVNYGSLIGEMSSSPAVVLNEWKLVGFTAYLTSDKLWAKGSAFFGTETASWMRREVLMDDLSSVSLIRIGDATNSFSGQVSFVNMLTPGGGFVTTTDLCSSTSSIELGVGSFPIACSGTNSYNPADSSCSATCPSDTNSETSFTGGPSLCCKQSFVTMAFNHQIVTGGVSCSDGTYLDGSTCKSCPSDCKTCSSSGCSVCNSGFQLYEASCVSSCPAKTYKSGSTCIDCLTNCNTCSSSGCSVCDSTYLLYEAGCVGSCPTKTYKSGSTCIDCSSNCNDCNSSGCSVCDSSYFLYNGDCVGACPDKTYKSGSTCIDCASDCLTCDNTGCLTCPSGFTLSGGSCTSVCGDKMYYDGSTCQNCPTNCKSCDATKCSSCDSSFFLYDGDCVSTCPDKTYQSGSICKDCASGCNTCSSSGCLDCDSAFLLYVGHCVDSCPAKTYKSGSTCKDCDSSCNNCDETGCLTCSSGFFLYDGDCLGSCPAKTYKSGLFCKDCPSGCKTCSPIGCLTCPSGSLLYNRDCVSSCPANTYQSGSTCKDCSSNCASCEDSSQCSTCDPSYLLYKGGCVSSCPAKSYQDLTSCIACSDNCSECDSSRCKACENNYKLETDNTCKATATVISSGSGLSGGAIAGIACGSILLLSSAGYIFAHIVRSPSSSFFKKNRQIRPFEDQSPADFGDKAFASPIDTEASALVH